MIYTGENKAVLCKGDFRPAQLYKGETKITGYTETEFEGAGGMTGDHVGAPLLENCYNDKVYDVQIRSKNLLDVKKVYPNYVNDEGGITFTNSHLSRILSKNMCSEYKTGISYTFSCDYVITSEGSSVYPLLYYNDGTYIAPGGSMGGLVTGTKRGHCKVTFAPEKAVSRIVIGYSTSQKTLEAKLTNMQLEEGTIETEYEPPCREANITVKSMENTEKTQTVLFENGVLAEEIPTFKGTSVIEIESDIAAKISGKYKRME